MYAIIKVDQELYDGYITGMENIATFPSEEEANNFIESQRQIYKESVAKNAEYLKQYIDNIQNEYDDRLNIVRDYLTNKFWAEKKPFPLVSLKVNLKYIIEEKISKPEDYNPPEISTNPYSLFVVKIIN